MTLKSKNFKERLLRDLLEIAVILAIAFVGAFVGATIVQYKAKQIAKEEITHTEWVKTARELNEPSAETLGGDADHTTIK